MAAARRKEDGFNSLFVRKNCFVRKTFSGRACVPWLHKVKQVPRKTTNQAPTLVLVEPIALSNCKRRRHKKDVLCSYCFSLCKAKATRAGPEVAIGSSNIFTRFFGHKAKNVDLLYKHKVLFRKKVNL